MFRGFPLLFAPGRVFEKIALAVPNAFLVFLIEVLPLLLLGLWLEFYGITHWPEQVGNLGVASLVPPTLGLHYVETQFAAFVGLLVIGATVLKQVAASFETKTSWGLCFVTLCYCALPLALSRALDAIPSMNTWACWAIGATLTARALYHGIAILLKPEQTKGFGLFLFSVVLITLLSALGHMAALMVQQGRLNP